LCFVAGEDHAAGFRIAGQIHEVVSLRRVDLPRELHTDHDEGNVLSSEWHAKATGEERIEHPGDALEVVCGVAVVVLTRAVDEALGLLKNALRLRSL